MDWQRRRFCRYWTRLSQRGRRPGRPRVDSELRRLIRQMVRENAWGAPRIFSELQKLGFAVSETTVARYVRRMTSFSRIIVFDKCGTGLSDRVPSGEVCEVEFRLEDLRAVLDANGLEKAVVFGTADGVSIAALFAARYPARVDGLVLLEGTARWMRDVGYEVGVTEVMNLPYDDIDVAGLYDGQEEE